LVGFDKLNHRKYIAPVVGFDKLNHRKYIALVVEPVETAGSTAVVKTKALLSLCISN
jgi:hypothetical protein